MVVELPILETQSVHLHVWLFYNTLCIFLNSTNFKGDHHLAFPGVVIGVRKMVIELVILVFSLALTRVTERKKID